MATKPTTKAIPHETALTLCREIREEQHGQWWRWTAWWCWGCEKASGGDPTKMCWHNHPELRGCAQVNARFAAGALRGSGYLGWGRRRRWRRTSAAYKHSTKKPDE